MKPALAVVALAVAVLALPALLPVGAHGDEHGPPKMTLLSPDPIAGDYTMVLRVEQFTLTDNRTDKDPDVGHLFYALNQDGFRWLPCEAICSGGAPHETTNTTFTFHGVKAGDKVAALLVNANGTITRKIIWREVRNINDIEAGPELAIDGTLPNPGVPNPGTYTMKVVPLNVRLVRPGSGEPNDRHSGHLLYLHNGQPCQDACSGGAEAAADATTFTFHDLALRDTVGVQLLNNDGTPFEPRAMAVLTVASPVLRILSAQAQEGEDSVLRVQVSSFTVSEPTDPLRANNAGAGHIHYKIKPTGEDDFRPAPGPYATGATSFQFKDLKEGDVVAAELVNHDHSSLDPPVVATQTVLPPATQDPFAPGVGPILALGLLAAAMVARRRRE